MCLFKQKDCKIQAEEIKNAIDKECDIQLKNVNIIGDLVISEYERAVVERAVVVESAKPNINFERPKYIESSIILNNCIFHGIVDFANTIFRQEANFDGSKFINDVLFCPRNGGILKSAEFRDGVSFQNSKFSKSLDCNSVKFRDFANFKDAIFGYSSNYVDFSYTIFEEDAIFVASDFRINANFNSARFIRNAIFSLSKFRNAVNFSEVIFEGIANFFKCEFDKKANFTSTYFNRDAIFTKSNFKNEFDLTGTRIKFMNLDEVEFQKGSALIMKNSYFDRIFVEWNKIKQHLKIDKKYINDAIFIALIKNFNDLGRYEDADDCKIYYKKFF